MYHCGCISCFICKVRQENKKKKMSEDYVFDIGEPKCIIKIVNIFLIYICQFQSPGKQTLRQIKCVKELLGIRSVKDKGEKTEVSL